MIALINAVWALPAVVAPITPLLARIGRRYRDCAVVATGAAVTTVAALAAAAGWTGFVEVEWVRIPGLGDVRFSVLVDSLSLTFVNIVAAISLAVFVYSLGHMSKDPGATRYFLLLLLFLASMELLVLSDDLLLLLFCWGCVSICSFLLISYWYSDDESLRPTQWVGEPPEEYPPSHCGLKAFLTTRFADAFMVLGAILLITAGGSSSISRLASSAPSAAGGVLSLSLLFMAIGAMGKSAQMPFLEWLPDAMAGPSGVSALIHAATMVKAGVYLVARLSQLALAWRSIIDAQLFFGFVAWSGIVTSLIASLQASVTSELKKTLAYSTASHIGYMMAALGAGYCYGGRAVSAVITYTLSHALSKSSLFLSAGILIHAMGSRFYRDLKGARAGYKLVYAAMALSALSLMGVPPFAGYWSKELVLLMLSPNQLLLGSALFSTAITAFYSVRMLFLLGGDGQREARAESLAELLPCLALALAGLALGLAWVPLLEEALTGGVALINVASLAAVALGAAYGTLIYSGRVAVRVPTVLLRVLRKRLYVNTLYYCLAERALSLAEATRFLEDAYNRSLTLGVRTLVEDFGKVARAQVGVISLRELLWVLTLLALLLLALLRWW